MNDSSPYSNTEDIQRDIEHEQELINDIRRNLKIIEKLIAKQGTSNVDLYFREEEFKEDLKKHRKQLQVLKRHKEELLTTQQLHTPTQIAENNPPSLQQKQSGKNGTITHTFAPDRNGSQWAFIVGVATHEEPSYGRLDTCDQDAELLYEQLAIRGFHPTRLVLLTGNMLTRLDHKTILSRLRSMARATTYDDLFLFYYSGFVDENDSDGYLVARNTLRQDLQHTAIAIQEVKKIINDAAAHAKVVILDICHARSGSSPEAKEQNTERCIRRICESSEGLTILAAYKQEPSQAPHSSFTYLLKDTLTTLDKHQDKGFVTVQDIYQGTRDNMKLFLASSIAPQDITLYSNRNFTPDDYLLSAYLYTAKIYQMLIDTQRILTEAATIYPSTCKRLLDALDQVDIPPQLEASYFSAKDAFITDGIHGIYSHVNQIIGYILDISNSSKIPSIATEKKHQVISYLQECALPDTVKVISTLGDMLKFGDSHR